MANSTEFEIDIDVKSDTVATAADKLDALQSRFDSAKSAASKAAEAVRLGQSAYDEAEKTAARAALAVERFGLKADAQRGKLEAAMKAGDERAFWRAAAAIDRLNQEQVKAQSAADAAKAAMDREADALKKLQDAESKTASEQTRLKKAIDDGKKSFDAIKSAAPTGKVNEMAEGLGKLGGPLGTAGNRALGLADAWGKLKSSLGAAGPYVAIAVALVAIATGLAAAGVAAAVAAGKALLWSVSMADAAMTQRLLADGIAKSTDGGYELAKAFESITSRIPVSIEELQGMAKKLSDAGLRGKALTDALEKTATAAAKAKFGPDFAKQLLTLDSQTARFKTNLAGVFGDLNTGPALEALSKLVALFDQNTASGRAMKAVFNSVFQPMLDELADLGPRIERVFLQMEIAVLKALIAAKPYSDWIVLAAQAFGVMAAVVLGVVAVALTAVAVNFAVMATAIGIVVTAVTAVVAGFIWLATTVGSLVVGNFMALVDVGRSVVNFLSGISLEQIGTNLVEGLARGIANAGGAVLKSITGVVDGAIGGAKKLLGIASPSKVFEEIGEFTGEGMVGGLDSSADGVQGSMESMIKPPALPSLAPAGGASAPGATITGPFIFNGVKDAEHSKGMLLDALEDLLSQSGAAVPA